MKSFRRDASFLGVHAVARLTLVVFLVAAVVLLWTEHRAHVLGAVPYVLLASCVLMHLFHGGHGGHGGHGSRDQADARGAGHVHGDTKP